MTNYDNISIAIGEKNWQNSITHDEGQFSDNGGGKTNLLLGQPGTGKTTALKGIIESYKILKKKINNKKF